MPNQVEWRFEALQDGVLEFERVLRGLCGSSVPPHSTFEDLALALVEMNAASKGELGLDEAVNYRERWRRAVGFSDIVRKALAVQTHKDFPSLRSHFLLLLRNSGLVQNSPTSAKDQTTTKVFELLVGLALMRIATDVRLDDPVRSKGDNPDVIAKIEGTTWGFACKTPHTANAKTYVDNVRVGVDQLERAPVDHGVVIMNLRNLINHDDLWSSRSRDGRFVYDAYRSEEGAEAALFKEGERMQDAVAAEFGGPIAIAALFRGKKAIPLVLNYLATVLGVIREGRQSPLTSMRRLLAWQLAPHSGDDQFFERFNEAMLGP